MSNPSFELPLAFQYPNSTAIFLLIPLIVAPVSKTSLMSL